MRSLLIAMLFACGGSKPTPTPPPPPPPADAAAPAPAAGENAWFDEAMKQMSGYADQMCACKDTACAKKVSDDMTEWGEKLAKEHPEEPKLTDAQTKNASDIGQRFGECMQKLGK